MKKILITGVNSYIGNAFKDYTRKWPKKYQVDVISLRDGEWKKLQFSVYDSIFHVAGIAHQKETEENRHLYYEVNRDLTIEVCKKAKADGVKQFILMSSMSVYGMDTGTITLETKPNPKSNYGKSKLQAEEEIGELTDKSFKVSIIRPPMVYGKGCKGNFQTVVKLIKKLPVFPRVNNQRSMIYIDNLSEFVRDLIDRETEGLFFPQNSEYMNTTQMAKWIAEALGKKVHMSWFLGLCVQVLIPFNRTARKAFGNMIYVQEMSECSETYRAFNLEDSVKETEN